VAARGAGTKIARSHWISVRRSSHAIQIATIKQGLRDNGLFEGRDYVLEPRFSNGNYELFPEMARDLAERGARILLVSTIASAFAAQKVTPPVPVVMLAINDQLGLVLLRVLRIPEVIQPGWQA
jgi:putative ABC transport system substrate-binding protein